MKRVRKRSWNALRNSTKLTHIKVTYFFNQTQKTSTTSNYTHYHSLPTYFTWRIIWIKVFQYTNKFLANLPLELIEKDQIKYLNQSSSRNISRIIKKFHSIRSLLKLSSNTKLILTFTKPNNCFKFYCKSGLRLNPFFYGPSTKFQF